MIQIERMTLQVGNFWLGEIDLRLEENCYATLMGPTGCGKTTMLEAICGLLKPNSGRILLGDRDVTKLDPSARGIGYVPQDRALFPTMRVDRQIEFGLRMRKVGSSDCRRRTAELAEKLDIKPLLLRYPKSLSGGEQQRVALARALSFRPKLLCLDEPLNALDDLTKLKTSDLLKRIHEMEKVTVLHATHDVAMSERLGDVHLHMTEIVSS